MPEPAVYCKFNSIRFRTKHKIDNVLNMAGNSSTRGANPRPNRRARRANKQQQQPKPAATVKTVSTTNRRNQTNAQKNVNAQQRSKQVYKPGPQSMAYPMCRLNPFTGGSAMYPGGGNAAVIVVDHRCFFDLRFGTNPGAVFLRILPCAPYAAIIHPDNTSSTYVVSNNKNIGDTYGPLGTSGTDTSSTWYPAAIMSEYDTSVFPGAGTPVPFGATKARITSCGFRIMYTGITQLARGLISMTPGALNVVSRETLPVGVNIRTQLDGAGTVITANTSDAIQVDGDVIASPCTPQTVTVPAAAGASGVLTQVSETLPFRPVTQGGAVLFADGKTESLICSTTGVRAAVGFYDESWAPVDIYVGSGDANTAFRVEVATCVEYQVETSSTVARFARKPPPLDRGILDSLEAAIPRLPNFGDLENIERTAARLLPAVKQGMGLAMKMASLAI